MVRRLLGRKVGMTQWFAEDRAIGATVIEASPCTIVRIKTADVDGYDALQLAYDPVPERKVTKPMAGHYRKCGVPPHRRLFEVRVEDPGAYSVGDRVGVGIFSEGDAVDVSGASRGKGFQGVMKRWNFAGGPKSHGSHFHRRPGSVGNCVEPGRVIKGRKLPGQMGARRVTVKRLQVLRVDPDRNLLVVKGGTPGARGTILELGKSHG